jgi:hypothetical protein
MQVSTRYRYVDKIASLNIGSYNSMDARIAVYPVPALSLAVAGQDLFQKRHEEYRSELARLNTSVERRFYTEVKWEF